jgi:hypothetical protein
MPTELELPSTDSGATNVTMRRPASADRLPLLYIAFEGKRDDEDVAAVLEAVPRWIIVVDDDAAALVVGRGYW